ncbi:zinc finger protein 585A-like [Trichogramma pretiosum]|uniref:zinc finger protein 585A-like n=1 Tax=Trichogramma pretiosum TaxID=7493 RepID=UPI0006C9CABC|nr:zinc finger protein 585A-like [Trichogramma pretiosum]
MNLNSSSPGSSFAARIKREPSCSNDDTSKNSQESTNDDNLGRRSDDRHEATQNLFNEDGNEFIIEFECKTEFVGNDLIKKEPPVAMQKESSKNRNRKSMIDRERRSKNKLVTTQNLFDKEVSINFACKTETESNPNHILTKKVRDRPNHSLRKGQIEINVGTRNGKSNTNFDDVLNKINKKIKNPKRKSVDVRMTQVAKKSLKPNTKKAVKKRNNYSCNSCEKTFTTNEGLKAHVNSKHKGVTYVCFVCGKGITSHYHLEAHKQSVNVGKRTRACDSCDKKFATRTYPMRHVRSVHNGVEHACNVCGKKYKFKKNLKLHIDSMHRKNEHVCDICGKKFLQKHSLKIHVNAVHKRVRHACDVCGKKYKYKGSLKVHKDFEHKKIARVCDFCKKEFSQKSLLINHINAEHNGVKHACSECGKKYKFKSNLKIHIDSMHRKIEHACDICGKKYTSKSMLGHHKDSKHRKFTYTCDICGKEFKWKTSIIKHIKAAHAGITRNSQKQTSKCKGKLKVHKDSSVHDGVTQSSCGICGKTFARKAQLRIHIKAAHNCVKPAPKIRKSNRKKSNDAARNGIPDKRDLRAKQFTSRDTRKNRIDAIRKAVGHSCDVCGKKFGQQSSLRIHLDSVHNNVRPCDICGEKFRWKATLKRHIKTMHKGHTCGTCGKTFKLRIQRLIHNRNEHDTTARKSFLSKSNPKSHVDTAITGVVAHSCDVCGKKFAGEKSVKIHAGRMHKGIKSQKKNIQ